MATPLPPHDAKVAQLAVKFRLSNKDHVRAAVDLYRRYEAAGGEVGVEAGRTERLTAGLRTLLFDTLTLKLEYQRVLAAPPEAEAEEGFRRDALLAQAVVAF